MNARQLDWGYVSYPPMTPFFARLGLVLFGESLRGLRVLPAIAQGVAIVLAGLMARDMGGRRNAQKVTEDLTKVVEQYPGAAAAAEALLRQGDIAAQGGQWEASVSSFRKFLELFPKHPLAANALMGGALWAIRDQHVGLKIVVAATVYAASILALRVITPGAVRAALRSERKEG